MNTLRVRCVGLALAVAAAACLLSASPAKPQAGPVWSYYDSNGQPYGGLRDPNTGLVWGFHTSCDFGTFDGVSFTLPEANALINAWPCCATNFTSRCTYPGFSNCFWNRADADWRVPTKAELTAAVQNGVFHNLDVSPNEGFQGAYVNQPTSGAIFNPQSSHYVWSSTLDKKACQGKKMASTVDIYSGHIWVICPQSRIFYIPVRGPVAP